MGNWGPELVALAGGRSLLSAPARLDDDAVGGARGRPRRPRRRAVRLRARAHAGRDAGAAGRPGWRDLRAVRAGRVFAADGNAYFNRAGPSLFETPEILAEMLHPDQFPPRREGTILVPAPAARLTLN